LTQDEKYRRYAQEAQEQAQRSRNATDKASAHYQRVLDLDFNSIKGLAFAEPFFMSPHVAGFSPFVSTAPVYSRQLRET
jgi:hypothetical protein